MTLQSCFKQLSELLQQTREYWQPVPFKTRQLSWQTTNPMLNEQLLQLTPEMFSRLESDRTLLREWLTPYIPALREFEALSSGFSLLPPQLEPIRIRDADRDIPGRKIEQITAFSRALSPSPLPFLDWCGGKGHLARSLSLHHQQSVTCLEWNAQLCDEGQQLAERLRLPVTMQPCDVLKESDRFISKDLHCVALHACGILHRRLLEQVAAHQVQKVSLSPCCYNLEPDLRTPESVYLPVSRSGRNTLLTLTNEDLRLALQETRHAGAREIRARERSRAWRLGFDLLQRDINGHDDYLPVPSLPASLLKGSFQEFCSYVVELKEMIPPSDVDYSSYEAAGELRLAEVNRLDLVRHAFGRFIEMWLVLDRAIFLEEAGYEVSVGYFCEEKVTGRNWLIQGRIG